MYQQKIMTQHPHPVADHGRRQHRTATDLRDHIRQLKPLHHLGSRVGKQMHDTFQNHERKYGRALNATSPGETQRHGTLWTIKQWK